MLETLTDLYHTLDVELHLHYRIIIFILCMGYIFLILYMEKVDEEEDEEQYVALFKEDQEFFDRLYKMEPDARNRYLKTIQKTLDDKNAPNKKKIRVIKKMKNTAIFVGLTELLLGSGGILAFLTTTIKTAFTIGMTGVFS